MENFKGEDYLYSRMRGKIFDSMTFVYFIYNTKPNKSDRQRESYKAFIEKTISKTFSSHSELVDLAGGISPGLGSTSKIFEISKELGLLKS